MRSSLRIKLLCKTAVFFAPFILFTAFQQLHLIPSQIFAVLYFFLSISYCCINNSKITNKILKEYQNAFQKGSCVLLATMMLLISFPIGGYLSVPLVVPHSKEKADAVVVLASGSTLAGDPCYATYQRILHGAELVKNNQTKHLYISTGYNEISQFKEYYAVASLTKLLDIPQNKITIFKSEEIKTTQTEASYIRKQLSAKNIDKILLTTSNAHIYRSCLTFKKAGFKEVYPAPSHDKRTTIYADDNLSMFRASMHEWIGLAWYWLCGHI